MTNWIHSSNSSNWRTSIKLMILDPWLTQLSSISRQLFKDISFGRETCIKVLCFHFLALYKLKNVTFILYYSPVCKALFTKWRKVLNTQMLFSSSCALMIKNVKKNMNVSFECRALLDPNNFQSITLFLSCILWPGSYNTEGIYLKDKLSNHHT